ncbi:type I-E CRISPR-associated protein Cse2/CasB [Azorhizophilus paspali]|uniref:Type I-E CRISPR-associated protein Cse2/CasB n=1 Tax=Azorhizophilus paspali TaxID=69963 RepID=A0ABV6SJW5_AZOPA
MNESAQAFIAHLGELYEHDPAAIAALRHSQGFAPGAYPPAYPYVERFVRADSHAQDPRRLAFYVVAGLFARHPHPAPRSLAASFGELFEKRRRMSGGGGSIEKRFIALLGADAENLPDYLRQAVSLLATEDLGLDYTALLRDLGFWLNPRLEPEVRDRIRQRWARDFYGALAFEPEHSAVSQ